MSLPGDAFSHLSHPCIFPYKPQTWLILVFRQRSSLWQGQGNAFAVSAALLERHDRLSLLLLFWAPRWHKTSYFIGSTQKTRTALQQNSSRKRLWLFVTEWTQRVPMPAQKSFPWRTASNSSPCHSLPATNGTSERLRRLSYQKSLSCGNEIHADAWNRHKLHRHRLVYMGLVHIFASCCCPQRNNQGCVSLHPWKTNYLLKYRFSRPSNALPWRASSGDGILLPYKSDDIRLSA